MLTRDDGDISAQPGIRCPYPTTTTLRAAVSDDTGVGSVVVYWSTERHSGSIKLAADGQGGWAGALGPIFDQSMYFPTVLPVSWSVEATDLAGNRATATASGRGAVSVHACQGPG